MKLMVNFKSIYIPFNIKIIVLKKNKIWLISCSKTLRISYINNLKIDKWNNCIIVKKITNKITKSVENKISKFLKSWNLFFYKKIKFKGKGFRIKFFKKIKIIKFYFGRSHKTFILLNKINKKKITKYKFIVFGNNEKKISNISKKIILIKKLNFYTIRGLRLNRQIIYKRKGKKGTYI